MNSAPKIFVFLLFTASLAACVSNSNPNSTANSQNRKTANSNSKTNPVKDDIEELEMTIKLPFRPEDAVWREESLGKQEGDNRVPSPNEKKLVAVLKFTKDEANQIVAQAEKFKPAAPATISAESWFPNELIAQSQTSGDETLKGTAYAANDFFQAPYLDGKITRIESADYFVLELFAK